MGFQAKTLAKLFSSELPPRVNGLFRGYPDLVMGFDIFLPHGYKIEAQIVESDCDGESEKEE